MTTPRRDGQHQSGLLKWVRECPQLQSSHGYNCMDIDVIWHKFRAQNHKLGDARVQHILLIEDKSHGAELPDQQHDLMFIVHQIMEFAPRIFQGFSSMRGDRVPIRYHGLTSIRYSGPSPDGSDWIKVGKKDVDLDQLIKILQFDISHLTLRPIDHRIGHHRRPDLLPFAETGAA